MWALSYSNQSPLALRATAVNAKQPRQEVRVTLTKARSRERARRAADEQSDWALVKATNHVKF